MSSGFGDPDSSDSFSSFEVIGTGNGDGGAKGTGGGGRLGGKEPSEGDTNGDAFEDSCCYVSVEPTSLTPFSPPPEIAR